MWLLCVLGGVHRVLSHHKDGCSMYRSGCWCVGGLIVGIIAMFAYNYLVMLVDRVVNKMEARTMEFMDLLNEPAQK